MPAETFLQLAAIQLLVTPTIIYQVPVNTQAIIKAIFISHSRAFPMSVKIWQNGSADANLILPATEMQPREYACYDGAITLAAGETLQGQSSHPLGGFMVSVEGVEIS